MKKTLLLTMFVAQISFAQQLPEPSIFHSPVIEQSDNYLQGNNYQKDFLLYVEMLRTTHPAFSNPETSSMHLDSIIQTGYYALSNCNSFEAFRLVMQSIVSPLHDGHSFVSLPDFSQIKFYPMNIGVYNGRFYIRVTDKENESLLGEEIQTINDIDINKIVNDFTQFISYNNEFEAQLRVTEYLLFPFLWQNFAYNRKDSTLHIQCKNGKEAIIVAKYRKDCKLVTITSEEREDSITVFTKQVFSYRIVEKDKLCYLQFNSCFDYNTAKFQFAMNFPNTEDKEDEIAAFEQKIVAYPRFDELLVKMFTEIQEKNITVLVVDVRNNSGGNSELCKQLLAYLYPIDSLNTGDDYVRISQTMEQQYPKIYENYKNCLAEQNKKLIIGNLYNVAEFTTENDKNKFLEKYFSLNEDSSKIFTGKTIFIQGTQTYSSAGNLIVWARDNKIGLIIGEKSIYRPCSYGDILVWKLPNTELTGGISHKYFTRPDWSKCNENYLTPDVLIEPTFEDWKQGHDPCWNWIIGAIK